MVRSAILILSLAAAASSLPAEGNLARPDAAPGPAGSLDPVFAPLPFQTWLTQTEQAHIGWSARVSRVQLTNYQRFSTRIDVEVDGPDLARRRGKGQFLILVQFSDERGCLWQYHQSIDLVSIPAGIKNSDANYAQSFFLLPGDYRLAIAVYDTATGEHNVTRRRLHVAPLKNDPLPDAWNGLPAVESIADDNPPGNWYLPSAGRVHLTVEPHHPIEVDLVVNLTPAEKLSGSTGAQNQNLSFLLPIFKVMAQTEWRNAKLNVALLDLAHHRVIFQQDDVRRFEWRRARRSLTEINPGVIDVEALGKRRDNANFFVGEIGRRIGEPRVSTPRVVIVLSSPVEFQTGQDLNPIEVAARPDFKVYYFRYQPQPEQRFTGGRPIGRRAWAPPRRLPRPQPFVAEPDQLVPLLKPVQPHLYDVTTPEQVRKALAGMMAEIAKM